MSWQPIETAPKDCEPILLGCWFPHQGLGFGGGEWVWIVSGYVDEDGAFCDFTDDLISKHRSPPTHWMPKPPTPDAEPAR